MLEWLSELFSVWYNIAFGFSFVFVGIFVLMQLAGLGLDAVLGLGGAEASGDGSGVDADGDAGVDVDGDAGVDVDGDAGGLDPDGHSLHGEVGTIDSHSGETTAATAAPGLFMSTMGFFNIGKVPLSLVAESLLLLFGLIGILLNRLVAEQLGAYEAYHFIAVFAAAAVASVTLVKAFSELMARYFPMSESYVASYKALLGRPAVVVSTTIDGAGGRAKVRDAYGNDIFVPCLVPENQAPIPKSSPVVLRSYDRQKKRFVAAVAETDPKSPV